MEALDQELGPFSHHVYLACCTNDLKSVLKLMVQLKSLGLKCASSHSYNDSQYQDSILERIKAGVNCSRKIVVYVTDDYMKDSIHTLEVEQMKDKARQFSRNKVIILKDSQLTDPLKKFMKIECNTLEVTKEDFSDQDFAKNLKEAILSGNPTILDTLIFSPFDGYFACIH